MIDNAKSFFASGRWATAQFKKAILEEGGKLSTEALRTLDTLRHEEWKFFDEALVVEATRRLVAVGDLIAAGLTRSVPNALGKLVFGYEKITDMDGASVSLDGLARTDNDRQEFMLNQLPLPITHKDFFINLRHLAASRNSGEPLDTTQARTAGRVVAEGLENMLINGGPTYGGMPIYGYTTHPDRLHYAFTGGESWDEGGKTGEDMLADVLYALRKLQDARMYGPFFVYVPVDAGIRLEGDFKANSDKTIRQRLLEVEGIQSVKTADFLASGSVLFVQASLDTAAWVQGEGLQTVQWDEYGGMQVNFKAMAIAVPLIRSTAAGRCGVFQFSDAGSAQD